MVSHIHGSLVASGLCPGSWIMLMNFTLKLPFILFLVANFKGTPFTLRLPVLKISKWFPLVRWNRKKTIQLDPNTHKPDELSRSTI